MVKLIKLVHNLSQCAIILGSLAINTFLGTPRLVDLLDISLE